MVEFGVVKAVQEVDGTRAGCRQANAEPARGLGVGGSHEGGRLLVVDEHEAHPVLLAPQPLHYPVYPVSRKPEDGIDTPVRQSLDEYFCSYLGHAERPTPGAARETRAGGGFRYQGGG